MESARQIRAEVARWRRTATTQRYPADLKELVVDYGLARRKEGASVYQIAQEVEVPEPTVARWLKSATAATTSTALLRVRVKPDKPMFPMPAVADSPVVITPRGWRVEGLSVADIAGLLQVAS